MLKKTALVCLVILTGAMTMSEPAEARDFAQIYVECGLGALIAPNTPVVAVITNITWDLGTTAISSEVSSPESCKGNSASMASFITDSYDVLEADLAAGAGPHLEVLATLAEGDGEKLDRVAFFNALRADFAKHASSDGYTELSLFHKAEALYDMVARHAG